MNIYIAGLNRWAGYATVDRLWTEYNEVYEADIRILKEAQLSLKEPVKLNSVKKPEKVLI